jgi:hypothetical protein
MFPPVFDSTTLNHSVREAIHSVLGTSHAIGTVIHVICMDSIIEGGISDGRYLILIVLKPKTLSYHVSISPLQSVVTV